MAERFWGGVQRRESQQLGEGGKQRGPELKQPSVGSKMATGKAGDRWSLSDAELEKWGEKEKEKINTITVRNLKINQKTLKINSLLLRFCLPPEPSKRKQRTASLGGQPQPQV